MQNTKYEIQNTKLTKKNIFPSVRRGPRHLRPPHDHDLHPSHNGHSSLLTTYGCQSSSGESSSSPQSSSISPPWNIHYNPLFFSIVICNMSSTSQFLWQIMNRVYDKHRTLDRHNGNVQHNKWVSQNSLWEIFPAGEIFLAFFWKTLTVWCQ